ncbi:MAG: heparan-alpha-glucosaminide N-acetyltransferase domain-containing protein [Puia sp.]|nr:heparan-alpha-glucosaminide N-acetyltransferase domain-containing protein [Puia sp.]
MPDNQKSERFLALDIFRGLTICFMIIVNSPGSGSDPYVPLDHAAWFGFTPTDLVFPSFLFAVGNALSFSKGKYNDNSAFLKKLLKRTVLIFLLGYLMYWFPFVHRQEGGGWAFNPVGHTRIMGVLQRIALCYFFGALLVHYLSIRSVLVVSAGLLVGYWAILYLFGRPGEQLTMLGNAGTLFDTWLLGSDHLYHDKGGPIAFDPEGVLSTLPAIVNVIGGYLAGVFIRQKGKNYETVARLSMTGLALIAVALFWGQFFPFAKKLWTSTFVLLTIGIDLCLLGVLVYSLEIRRSRRGVYFFHVFGRNPLAIYLLSELLFTVLSTVRVRPGQSFYDWVNTVFFQSAFPGPFGTLVYAVCYMLVCWLVGYWLDRRRIYIKI